MRNVLTPEAAEQKKKELLQKFGLEFEEGSPTSRTVNSNRKKVATYENILRFYQNCIITFALTDHTHYAQDIIQDEEHMFITKDQLDNIQAAVGQTATLVDIDLLFSGLLN